MPTFEIDCTCLTCCHAGCGIVFFVPIWWEKKRREDHTLFYCPNGHSQSFGESKMERELREKTSAELRLQSRLNEANHARLVAEKERDSERRKRRKIELRVSRGVCPCCNRTFEDLYRHMATKHKDYALPPGKLKEIEATKPN